MKLSINDYNRFKETKTDKDTISSWLKSLAVANRTFDFLVDEQLMQIMLGAKNAVKLDKPGVFGISVDLYTFQLETKFEAEAKIDQSNSNIRPKHYCLNDMYLLHIALNQPGAMTNDFHLKVNGSYYDKVEALMNLVQKGYLTKEPYNRGNKFYITNTGKQFLEESK